MVTRWETREAANIMGFLPGSGRFSGQTVLITTYFDAYSVVPSLSTGASEAVSPSILLTLAKYYSELPKDERPDYDIIFVAFSGHNQGIWGAREWTEEYVYGPYNPEPYNRNVTYRNRTIAETVDLIVNIDIIPDTPWVYPGGIISGFFGAKRVVPNPIQKPLFESISLVPDHGERDEWDE